MLKYYSAYNSVRTKNPKGSYINDFNAIVDQTFDNASNVFYDEIEFEYEYGSNVFIPIPKVRVDNVGNYNTSMTVDGEDYKTFIFTPDFPKPIYGMKFKWGNNYWLVINTNNAESINITAVVRRCNNVLRFFDKNGNKIYEPCIMDTTLRFTNNIDTTIITTGKEEQKIWCQRNDRTTSIKPNDKFLFGTPNQRYALTLYAGGMKNELNTETMNDNSPSLTEFYTKHYQVNPEYDDLENGFANAYSNRFEIEIGNIPTVMDLNTTGKLLATIKKNKGVIDAPLIWESSDSDILEIDEENNYTALDIGEVIVTAKMEDNEEIYSSIVINVVEEEVEDVFEIIVNPNINYILQNTSKEFTCYLYKNGEKTDAEFDFIDESKDIPKNKYSIIVKDKNTFEIKSNGMYMDAPVSVRCVSGEYTKNIEITLRGLY